MVVLSVPLVVPNFEGQINHVCLTGRETLAFIKLTAWEKEFEKISAKIQQLSFSLEKVTSLREVQTGEAYILKTRDSFERAHVIRRPLPELYTVYFIDKGVQCDVEFGEFYEYPSELLEFGVFNCVCPVRVPAMQDLSIYNELNGLKCKCDAEAVSEFSMIIGFVRGRLYVEEKGRYKNIEDVIYQKLADLASNSGLTSSKHLRTAKRAGYVAAQKNYTSSSSSDSTSDRFSRSKTKTRISRLSSFRKKGDFSTSKKEKHNKPVRTTPASTVGRGKIKTDTLFYQRGFKHYVPDVLPMTVAVRFDKKDRNMNSFWVVHKDIFAAAEKALKQAEYKLSHFPTINQRGDDVRVKETPCIVRARIDKVGKSLYRGVPAQYDAYTKRVSIFLVDFGWFKWMMASDVLDISSMDESNPIRNLPAAMIHCREDRTSTHHADDLIKGADCEIIIKGNALRDLYTVDLLGPPKQENVAKAGNMRENDVLASCNKLINETYQRQLMTSMMMMESLNVASREWTQNSQTLWPASYRAPFPMALPVVMPVVLPLMMQMPITTTTTNVQSAGDSVATRPENTVTGNFEGVKLSNNHSRGRSDARANYNRFPTADVVQNRETRFRSKDFQPANELSRTDSGLNNEFGVVAGDMKASRNSCEEEDGALSLDLPLNSTKPHRKLQISLDSNAQEGQPTDLKKAEAAHQGVRNQQDHDSSSFGGD